MLLGRDHPRDRERRQRLRLVLDMLDLKPDHGELVGELFQRLVGVEMFLQPGEREFHGCEPRIPVVFSACGIRGYPPPWPSPPRGGGKGKTPSAKTPTRRKRSPLTVKTF